MNLSLQKNWLRPGFLLRFCYDNYDRIFSDPYDRLLLWSDSAGWSLDDDAVALLDICNFIGVKARFVNGSRRRYACIHYLSQFVLEEPEVYFGDPTCRYSVAYYHGGPEDKEYEQLFEKLILVRRRLTKVHVSTSRIAAALQDAGFDHEQLARIPIGIRVAAYSVQTEKDKSDARRHLGLPGDAFVVGSFQKDGVGWGEGLEPKLIKGPDVFVDTLAQLKHSIPNLYVLLSGPARGYVKKGLEKAGIPYRHKLLESSAGIPQLHQALDCYLMCSRIEGGPKSLLEAMAAGVPLVATNVGQGVDLMFHGKNAYVVEPDDVDGLRQGVLRAYQDPAWFDALRPQARATAEQQDYLAQAPLWREKFFNGYIEGSAANHTRRTE